MTPQDQEIALILKSRVMQCATIKDYRVFGSRARGDHTEDSDLDIFIQVDHLNADIRQEISECAWEVGFDHNLVITTFVADQQQIDNGIVGVSPIFRNIEKEGVSL